jgi:hypothetical protein
MPLPRNKEILCPTDAGRETPLFRAALGKTGKLTERPLDRRDAYEMIKRRLKDAAITRATAFAPQALLRFWKMTADWKPRNGALGTIIVVLRSYMTAEISARR